MTLGKKRIFLTILILTGTGVLISYLIWGKYILPTRPSREKVLAKVGRKYITVDDFKNEIALYIKSQNFQLRVMSLTPEGRENILNRMIDRLIFVQAAKEDKIKLDREILAMLERLKEDKLAEKYISKKIDTQPITEDEMMDYYKKNIKEFTIPERIKLRHIVVSTRKEAEKLLSKLKKGADFAELAQEYNIDATKKRGGNLGWIRRGIMVKEFENAAFKLKEGQISPVVKTSFGYHIIKLEGRKKEEIVPFEKVKKDIREKIRSERIRELKDTLKKRYKIKINENLWEKVKEKEGGKQK